MTTSVDSTEAREATASLVAGILFGAGLVLSGMTDPAKVVAFLDFTHGWDPSLMLVMVGAIGVHAALYRLVKDRPSPLVSERWSLPTRRDIEPRLVVGSAIFGIGWGLGGYCPGPGLVSLVGGSVASVVFVVCMFAGIRLVARLESPRHVERGPVDDDPTIGQTLDGSAA